MHTVRSIQDVRAILGPDGESLTDEEVRDLRDQYYALARTLLRAQRDLLKAQREGHQDAGHQVSHGR